MKRFSRKNIKKFKNKSIKNLSKLQIVPVNYYSKNFKDTKLIPKTSIINYIFSGYNDFLSRQKITDSQGVFALDFNNCFITNSDTFKSGLRSNTINLSFKMNPETPLDKLIAYSFYLKQSYIFEKKNQLEDIKYQIGKDVKRSKIKINEKIYDTTYYKENENYYSIADIFYQNIIDELYKNNNKNINLNIVNKLGLLSCQNILNLITDLISLKLNKILEPETNSVFRPKFANIIKINHDEISMELTFKSELIISRDGQPMDPEYPCGNLEFSLYIDILHGKYKLKKFILSYDINKCGPEIQEVKDESDKSKSNLKAEYIIPASIVTAGIVATPFLISALGGKKKRIKKQKKNQKTKKNRNIK